MDADEIIKKHNKGGWVLLEIYISFEETGRIKFSESPSYTVLLLLFSSEVGWLLKSDFKQQIGLEGCEGWKESLNTYVKRLPISIFMTLFKDCFP